MTGNDSEVLCNTFRNMIEDIKMSFIHKTAKRPNGQTFEDKKLHMIWKDLENILDKCKDLDDTKKRVLTDNILDGGNSWRQGFGYGLKPEE